MITETVIPEHEIDKNPFPFWLRWNRTSPQLLIQSETKLLQRLRSTLKGFFVPIFGGKCFIRTVLAKFNDTQSKTQSKDKIPLVLIHGFASGLGLWCKNVDAIAAHRPVYTFDLLGFGRSSRPQFPKEADEVETYWVDSVEEWRSAMNLDSFVLVGHSLGGFISTAYALRHPHRVAHLILVDPWGFNEAPVEQTVPPGLSYPIFRAIRGYLSWSSPLAILRALGPLGRSAIHRVRGDLRSTFDQRSLISGECLQVPSYEEEEAYFTSHDSPRTDSDSDFGSNRRTNVVSRGNSSDSMLNSQKVDDLDGTAALDYIYHINVQTPSGEVAFKTLCSPLPWARYPMLQRVDRLDRAVPMTFIFGSRSWMDISSGTKTKAKRPDSYVDIRVIEGAGHQVYAQAADEFNACVNEVAARVDAGELFGPGDATSPLEGHTRRPSKDQAPKKRRSVTSRPRIQGVSSVIKQSENDPDATDETSS